MKGSAKAFKQVQGGDYKTGRTVHLVDVENLVGNGEMDFDQAAKARDQYTGVAGYQPGDHVIVACGHAGAPGAFFAWNGLGQMIKRSGKDGADIALVDYFYDNELWTRFDRIVIGSGDNRFLPVCTKSRNEGLEVTIVARTASSVYGGIRASVYDIRVLTPTLVLPELELEFAYGA